MYESLWALSLAANLDFTHYEMFPVVITHHNILMREDNKIESQNKKVRAAHDTLIRIKEKVDKVSAPGTRNSSTSLVNMLSKATKSLEKSNEAFEKAVGGGMSLVGTGSGKVPLLLPVVLETDSEEATTSSSST